jgi:hypothetical protein
VIVLVLRASDFYTAEDVEHLTEQLVARDVVCLSDVPVPCERISLRYKWPGWWSKMEMFRPDLGLGDFLYFDLDTIIRGNVAHMERCGHLATLRDFYRPEGLGSGMMFIPEAERAAIWQAWIADPDRWMSEHSVGGDQEFMERYWLGKARRLQDIYPGEVVSFKANTTEEVSRARVVCFHGRPKPRDVQWRV